MTKRDVRELLEDLAEGELAARGKPTKVAPRNLKALLSKLFDWAADREMVPGNPAAGVKLPARVREHLKRGGRVEEIAGGRETGAAVVEFQSAAAGRVLSGGRLGRPARMDQ